MYPLLVQPILILSRRPLRERSACKSSTPITYRIAAQREVCRQSLDLCGNVHGESILERQFRDQRASGFPRGGLQSHSSAMTLFSSGASRRVFLVFFVREMKCYFGVLITFYTRPMLMRLQTCHAPLFMKFSEIFRGVPRFVSLVRPKAFVSNLATAQEFQEPERRMISTISSASPYTRPSFAGYPRNISDSRSRCHGTPI